MLVTHVHMIEYGLEYTVRDELLTHRDSGNSVSARTVHDWGELEFQNWLLDCQHAARFYAQMEDPRVAAARLAFLAKAARRFSCS